MKSKPCILSFGHFDISGLMIFIFAYWLMWLPEGFHLSLSAGSKLCLQTEHVWRHEEQIHAWIQLMNSIFIFQATFPKQFLKIQKGKILKTQTPHVFTKTKTVSCSVIFLRYSISCSLTVNLNAQRVSKYRVRRLHELWIRYGSMINWQFLDYRSQRIHRFLCRSGAGMSSKQSTLSTPSASCHSSYDNLESPSEYDDQEYSELFQTG